jgi:membrane fusion protein, heavy metal efflux system
MPAVPQDAVVYDGAQARVWVALPEQKTVIARRIEVGDAVTGMVEVRKGLSTGESVVSSGVLFIDRAARRN